MASIQLNNVIKRYGMLAPLTPDRLPDARNGSALGMPPLTH